MVVKNRLNSSAIVCGFFHIFRWSYRFPENVGVGVFLGAILLKHPRLCANHVMSLNLF